MIIASGAADSDVTWTSDLCVFSNQKSGSYAIKASGSAQADGAFVLSRGAHTLPYHVGWNAHGKERTANHSMALKPNAASEGLVAATNRGLCDGNASNARLVITIPKQTLPAVAQGGYADTLTLLVSAH